jgi:hypothetical protein
MYFVLEDAAAACLLLALAWRDCIYEKHSVHQRESVLRERIYVVNMSWMCEDNTARSLCHAVTQVYTQIACLGEHRIVRRFVPTANRTPVQYLSASMSSMSRASIARTV